jgi:hypothetical protein
MGFAKNAAIAAEERGYAWTDRALCPAHVDDYALKAVISANLSEPSCSYCSVAGNDANPVAVPLDVFLEAFMVGVHLLYEDVEASGVPIEEGERLTSVYDVENVVRSVLDHAVTARDADEALAADIAAAMTTAQWVDRDWQRLSPDQVMQYSWESFKRLVKHSTRFFFSGVLGDPADDETLSASRFFQELASALVQIPEIFPRPCPVLYRGRMTATEPAIAKNATASELGPPPPEKAAANRMSPAGISMFYGATNLDTAIAEIGAHSSYGHAVTGEFTPAREIRLIDLTKLPELPSIFDNKLFEQYYTILFLHRFVQDLTLPIDLDGREHIDYVPTQAFTEYLRYSFPARADGLMFPSSQGPGAKVVVFYGPDFCTDKGAEGEYTRLTLDPASAIKHRVTTVIRR